MISAGRLLLALSLWLGAVTPLHAADRVMKVDAQLSLAANGEVSSLQWRDSLPAALSSDLEQRVRSWRFDPVVVDGQPAAAALNLTLQLRIEEVEDRLRFHVQSAQTNLFSTQARPPRYPRSQLRAGRSGFAVLSVQIDESGSVTEARVLASSHEAFAKASLGVAQDWQYEPLRVAGQPAATTLLVPVSFTIAGQAPQAIELGPEHGGLGFPADTARLDPAQGGQPQLGDTTASR